MNQKISVILADDHPIVMDGFQKALESVGIEVKAKVADPADVVDTYEALKPGVLILDVLFGNGRSGLEVLEKMHAKYPETPVVILSQSDRFETIKAAFEIGAMAYITKDCAASELEKGIRLAVDGKKYCTEKIGAALAVGITTPTEQLNPQQLEILRLVAEGMTLEEIGEHFGQYKRWAGRQVTTLKEHFNVERNAELVRIAVKLGIIDG